MLRDKIIVKQQEIDVNRGKIMIRSFLVRACCFIGLLVPAACSTIGGVAPAALEAVSPLDADL